MRRREFLYLFLVQIRQRFRRGGHRVGETHIRHNYCSPALRSVKSQRSIVLFRSDPSKTFPSPENDKALTRSPSVENLVISRPSGASAMIICVSGSLAT